MIADTFTTGSSQFIAVAVSVISDTTLLPPFQRHLLSPNKRLLLLRLLQLLLTLLLLLLPVLLLYSCRQCVDPALRLSFSSSVDELPLFVLLHHPVLFASFVVLVCHLSIVRLLCIITIASHSVVLSVPS